jgi:hypothetical protein
MAGQVFLGVFLAGIALMLVYWLFTNFHWFTILFVGGVLWLTIFLLKEIIGFFTREKPTEEQKEKRKRLLQKEKENAARIESNRIKNLKGFAKFWHYAWSVFLYALGAAVVFVISYAIFDSM